MLIAERHLGADARVVGGHIAEDLACREIDQRLGVGHKLVDDNERRLFAADGELLDDGIGMRSDVHVLQWSWGWDRGSGQVTRHPERAPIIALRPENR